MLAQEWKYEQDTFLPEQNPVQQGTSLVNQELLHSKKYCDRRIFTIDILFISSVWVLRLHMNHMACSVHSGSGIGVPAVGHDVGPLEKQLVTLSTEPSPHPAW